MSKVKRQPFGETPEPAARKLRVDGEKAEQKDERTIDKDHIRAISLTNLSPESVWNTIISHVALDTFGSSLEIVNKARHQIPCEATLSCSKKPAYPATTTCTGSSAIKPNEMLFYPSRSPRWPNHGREAGSLITWRNVEERFYLDEGETKWERIEKNSDVARTTKPKKSGSSPRSRYGTQSQVYGWKYCPQDFGLDFKQASAANTWEVGRPPHRAKNKRRNACLLPFDAGIAFDLLQISVDHLDGGGRRQVGPLGHLEAAGARSCSNMFCVSRNGKVFWPALLMFVLPDFFCLVFKLKRLLYHCRKDNQTSEAPPQDSQESRWTKHTKLA